MKSIPTLKHFVAFAVPYTIILVAIFSILPYPSDSISILTSIDSTMIWWTISFLILIIYFFSRKYYVDYQMNKDLIFINLYFIWTLICILRGVFVAENYWDWKVLTYNTMGLSMPIVVYSATNKIMVQAILSFYVKYGLPLFFILMFLIRTDAYGFYLMPISFLLLFLPALSLKQRIILLVLAVIIFISDLSARSNVIKFGIPILVLIFYYLKDKLSTRSIEFIRLVLIILPIVLLALGASNIFNILKISDYVGEIKGKGTVEEGQNVEVNVIGDTRTFIYVEVLESAIKNNYWVFGRTPARGNDSPSFGPQSYELTGRDERLSNEIGVANIFTWTGIIGVIIYLLIFYRASYLAINRSENIYAKMLGVYVAFRWFWSWVEDINNFSLNYFMLMLMIGLCFSYSFRKMSDFEVTVWIRGVFDYRYLHFEKYLKREKKDNKLEL